MEEKSIPYFVHEGDMARAERTIRRLWILCIILVLLLTVTNGAWLYYESQFEDVVTTEYTQDVTQDADGDGSNTFIGGDSYGTTESKTDNQDN